MALTWDAFTLVLQNCSTLSLLRCAQTCRVLRTLVSAELHRHYFAILRTFFGSRAAEVHDLLQSHHAVISGSTALAFLTWPNTWSPGDMDIYVANAAYPRFILELEQRALVFSEADSGAGAPSLCCGIAAVRHFLTSAGKSIDVIQSSTANAAHPLLHFWSSLVVNILGPSGVLCVYPSRTLDRRALVTDLSHADKFVDTRIKYEARGFKFTTVASWKPISPVDDHGNLVLSDSPAMLIDFQSVWSGTSCGLPVVRVGTNWVLFSDESGPISGEKLRSSSLFESLVDHISGR